MECKSSPKPNRHSFEDKHLVDPKDDICSSGQSPLLGHGTRTKETVNDTLVHRYTYVGVNHEPVGGLHRQLSTEDNATSCSKPDTVLKVDYLNKSSVDPAAGRTKTDAVAANTEVTTSEFTKQIDSSNEDVPHDRRRKRCRQRRLKYILVVNSPSPKILFKYHSNTIDF